MFEDANIARIGRTSGRVYISKAVRASGIIDIVGRRKYTSDVFPCIKLVVYFFDSAVTKSSTATFLGKQLRLRNEAFCNLCMFFFKNICIYDASQWLVDGLPGVGQISLCTNLA